MAPTTLSIQLQEESWNLSAAEEEQCVQLKSEEEEKRHPFLSFPYVFSEPVLVK